MKKTLIAMMMAAVIAAACNNDDDNNTPSLSSKDQSFIQKAGPANQAEIELGQVAASRSTTDSVVMFGNMMATEHGESVNELKSIGSTLNFGVPTALDAEHQSIKSMIMTMSGHSLDTAYIHGQIKDHQKTVALFQSEIDSGSNASVKAYAAKYLPHVQMHLNRADSIWNQLNE